MKIPMMLHLVVLSIALFLCAPPGFAQEMKPMQLPTPQMEGGKPLMQAFKERSSSRSFGPEKLSPQTLSNLLWAAFGINRADSGRRTAPSALNWQEIDIYVSMVDGLYRYEAKGHTLEPILSEDVRALMGQQPFVANVPVNLIYVADLSKMGSAGEEHKVMYSAADTGFISQNVYLFCASEGLATVVRGAIDREAMAKKMKLRPDQRIILAQSVGYPKR